MRIAVIADIHGNDFAFELVENDIQSQNINKIVCLGDAIQGGPQPAEVMQRLHRLNCPVVMGNADDWLLTGRGIQKEDISAERLEKMDAIKAWSISKLTDDDKKYIAGFSPTISIMLENDLELLCFHGSPDSYEDIIAPTSSEEEFQKILGKYSNSILTGGHTHTQQIRRCGENFFLNPGSVGMAYNRYQSGQFFVDAWAEYAILTVENKITEVQFRRIHYAAKDMIDVYLKSGRPFVEDAIAQYQPH